MVRSRSRDPEKRLAALEEACRKQGSISSFSSSGRSSRRHDSPYHARSRFRHRRRRSPSTPRRGRSHTRSRSQSRRRSKPPMPIRKKAQREASPDDNRGEIRARCLSSPTVESRNARCSVSPYNSSSVKNEDTDILVVDDAETLEKELLECLGEGPKAPNEDTFQLHEAIACRWSHLMSKGLLEADRENLLAKYPLPGNCTSMSAPKLNCELLPILTAPSIKRDKSLTDWQNQLGAALSGIGHTLNDILNANKNEDRSSLQSLSDARRLLTDLHHNISIIRRQAITTNLSKSAKEVADSSQLDGFLFGKDFGESCKAAKNSERSSRDLKGFVPQAQKTRFTSIQSTSGVKNPRTSLNRRGPPRYEEPRRNGPNYLSQRRDRGKTHPQRYRV